MSDGPAPVQTHGTIRVIAPDTRRFETAIDVAVAVALREIPADVDPVDQALLRVIARSEIAQALPSQCLPRLYSPLWHESNIEGGHTPRTRWLAHRVMVSMREAFTMAYPSLIKPARWQSMPNLRRLIEDMIADRNRA